MVTDASRATTLWFLSHLSNSEEMLMTLQQKNMCAKVLFSLFLLIGTSVGKKGLAKLKLQAEKQNLVQYEAVALFSYGSDTQNRFTSSLQHFKLSTKHLSVCDKKFSLECQEELRNELKKLKSLPTIVLILNSDHCMVNFFQDMILKHFSKNPLKAYRNTNDKHGWNLVGDAAYVLKNLDDPNFASKNEELFSDVGSWRDVDFIVNSERKEGQSFVSNPTKNFPLVLLQEVQTRNKFDYFLNVIEGKSSLRLEEHFNFPEISVYLLIHERPLFFEEFVDKFTGQNYPKDKINLLILDPGQKLLNKFKDYQSVEVLKNLEIKAESQSKFVLFLHSSAILDDPNTMTDLVQQDLPFVAPLLETNFHQPSYKRFLDLGWNRTSDKIIQFPTSYMKEHDNDWRIQVNPHLGKNSLLLSHFRTFAIFREDAISNCLS